MSNALRLAVFFACVLSSTIAAADPVVVTTTTLVTSGVFSCRGLTTCSGAGTESITLRNGSATATLT